MVVMEATLPSFAKYACASWLAWLFCLNSEFDFLLASCSEERVPKHMSNKGGWVDPLPIDNNDAKHGGNQKGTKKEKALLTTIAFLNGMTNTLSAHLLGSDCERYQGQSRSKIRGRNSSQEE